MERITDAPFPWLPPVRYSSSPTRNGHYLRPMPAAAAATRWADQQAIRNINAALVTDHENVTSWTMLPGFHGGVIVSGLGSDVIMSAVFVKLRM